MTSKSDLLAVLRRSVLEQSGYLTAADVATIAEADRLRLLLVRCGNCRFLAAAQDVAHLVAIIRDSGRDHVRDISLPQSDNAFRTFRRPVAVTAATRPAAPFREDCCGGSFDGFGVISDADPGL